MDDMSVSAGGNMMKDKASRPLVGSGLWSMVLRDTPIRAAYTGLILLVGWGLWRIVPPGSYHHGWAFTAWVSFALWPWVTGVVSGMMFLCRGLPTARFLLAGVRILALAGVFGVLLGSSWLTFFPEHESFLGLPRKAYNRFAPTIDLGWLTGRPKEVDWNQPSNWLGDTVQTSTMKRPVPPSE